MVLNEVKHTARQVLGSILAEEERIQEWSTDTDGRCSKGNCFENIRSPFKTAVDVNLELVKDLRTVLPQLKEN